MDSDQYHKASNDRVVEKFGNMSGEEGERMGLEVSQRVDKCLLIVHLFSFVLSMFSMAEDGCMARQEA